MPLDKPIFYRKKPKRPWLLSKAIKVSQDQQKSCELLSIPRSAAYYPSKPVNQEELDLMRRLDQLHLQYPFKETRRLNAYSA